MKKDNIHLGGKNINANNIKSSDLKSWGQMVLWATDVPLSEASFRLLKICED